MKERLAGMSDQSVSWTLKFFRDDRIHGEGKFQSLHATSPQFSTRMEVPLSSQLSKLRSWAESSNSLSPFSLLLTNKSTHRGYFYNSFRTLAKERSHRALVMSLLHAARQTWGSLCSSFSSYIIMASDLLTRLHYPHL